MKNSLPKGPGGPERAGGDLGEERREYPKLPIVAVGGVLIKEGKLLLIRRGVEPGRGRWSIPGGMVELGETLVDALKREVKEEVGLDVEVEGFVEVVDNIIRDGEGRVRFHYVILDFKVHPVGGEVRTSAEAQEIAWVSPEEMKNYIVTSSALKLFKKVGFIKEDAPL